VGFVEARARVSPEVGARWVEVAGAYATFDDVGSPLTQTFCLGLFGPPTEDDLGRIEAFFGEHGAQVFHEVSPLADPALLDLLNGRGYQPAEFTSVMFRPLRPGARFAELRGGDIRVRVVGDGEHGLWARTAARGWGGAEGLTDFILGLARVNAARADAPSFLAELDGRAVATGAMSIHEGVALLAGASTVPEARGRGAQLALLDAPPPRRRTRMRPRDDVCAARQRLAAQRGAPRLPHRLHARQVAALEPSMKIIRDDSREVGQVRRAAPKISARTEPRRPVGST
jgi:hypothetical protein